MKRLSCVVLFLLVLGGIGSAQEIKVTHPWSGQSWNIGDAQDIRWTAAGVTQPNVKITLWREATNVLDIVDNAPNNGRYRWTIPGSIAPGTYKIRVKAVGASTVGISAAFNIGNAKITVTQPSHDVTWNPGETQLIQWTHSGPMASTVSIKLYPNQAGHEIYSIVNSTDNDGSYSWTIPANVPSLDYTLAIRTVDSNVTGEGPNVRIGSGARVLAPKLERPPMLMKLPALSVSDVKLVPYDDGLVITFSYKNSGTGPLPKSSEMPEKPDYRVLIDSKEVARGKLFIPAFEAQPGWEVPSFFGYEIKYETQVFDLSWTIGNLVTVIINENRVNGMASDSETYNLKPMALNYSYDVMIGGLTYDWDRMLLTFTVRIDGNIGSFNKFRYRGTYANNIMDRTIDIIPGKRLYTIERVLDKAGTSRTELYVAILVSLVESPGSPDDRRDIEHRNNQSAYTFRR